MLEGYPYIFQMNDKMYSDEYLEYTLQYRFKSEKSHHTYIVRVEKYIDHAYCVKFFDKANMLSDNKFSLRTNTFEPRRIISTVFNIMFDVLKKDEKASFFFLGAEDEKDIQGKATRRFQFYSKFVASVISDKIFEHFRLDELSLYILVNKNNIKNAQEYAENIKMHVREVITHS